MPHFVTCKFYACIIDCSIFIKTSKTVYHLINNEVTVASINLADELVNLLIFDNNEHFALTQSQWERCRMRTKCECRCCVAAIRSNFAKAI